MRLFYLHGRRQLTSLLVCCAPIFFAASWASAASPSDTEPTEKTSVSVSDPPASPSEKSAKKRRKKSKKKLKKGKKSDTSKKKSRKKVAKKAEEGEKSLSETDEGKEDAKKLVKTEGSDDSEVAEEKNEFAGKVIELKGEKNFSVSRNFMKLFDKSHVKLAEREVKREEEPVIIEGDGISVTKPNGWARVFPDDPNVVLAFEEAGVPTNRIEIRRGYDIAPSRFDQYLDSFRTMLENAGFETTLNPDSGGIFGNSTTSDDAPSNISVPFLEKSVGGLSGEYLQYQVATADVVGLLRGQKRTGLLLFLYEGRHAPWIFVAFSTSGEVDRLRPFFEMVLRTAQFDIDPTKKSEKL